MADTDLPERLQLAGSITIAELTNEVRLSAAKQSGTERVAFTGSGDGCPACAALNGKIFRVTSAEVSVYSPPIHINCYHYWAAVDDDEVGAEDLFDPNDQVLVDLVREHAHFVVDDTKYVELRVTAPPAGPDFTFRRGKAGERGTIEYHRPTQRPAGLDPGVRETGVLEPGKGWAAVDERPPLNRPASNEPIRRSLTAEQRARTAAVEQRASELWPDTAIDLSSMHPDVAERVVNELERLSGQWPEVMTNLAELRAADLPTAFGSCDASGTIIKISSRGSAAAGELEADLLESGTIGGEPHGLACIEGTVAEEFGHALCQQALSGFSTPEVVLATDRWMEAHPQAAELSKRATALYSKAAAPGETFAIAFAAHEHVPAAQWPPTSGSATSVVSELGEFLVELRRLFGR